MPRIWYEQGFRFSFYSGDRGEPAHVHVSKKHNRAKWWIDPIREARPGRFTRAERSAIRSILRKQREILLAEWRAYFDEGR